jgi:DNA-binding GntR family transcriptional regulator
MQARHEEIANAIERRDAQGAGCIMGHHFDGAVMKFIKDSAHQELAPSG